MDNASTLQLIYKREEYNNQPNLITESRQDFSEIEKKIFSFVINQMKRKVLETATDGRNLEFLIPVSELTEKNHSKIIAAAKSIINKKITINDTPKGLVNKDRTDYYRAITPFPEVHYYKLGHLSYLRLTLFSNVVEQFIYLSNQYTRYSLNTILSLNSVYSQRIYEILMMYAGRKQTSFTYTIDKLKEILNCPESYIYNDIKKRALEPALKELKEKADIYFTYKETTKVRKRVDELTFYIKTKKDAALDALSDEAVEFDKSTPLEKRDHVLRMLNNYKFSKAQQNDIMSDPKKWSVFMQLDAEIFHGLRTDIENPTAYIAKSLGFDKVSAKTKSK